jgi:cell division protein ZapA
MSKADLDSVPTEAVEVTIFSQTYRLRSKADGEHVREVARLVDERMRAISSEVGNHDPFKIAVLAALNIADEMQNLRNYYESEIQPLLAKPSRQEVEKEDKTEAEADKSQTWFEDFFEAKVETKSREERLSSQVAAKLKSLRQSSPDKIGITSEDDAPTT